MKTVRWFRFVGVLRAKANLLCEVTFKKPASRTLNIENSSL